MSCTEGYYWYGPGYYNGIWFENEDNWHNYHRHGGGRYYNGGHGGGYRGGHGGHGGGGGGGHGGHHH